MPPTKNSDIATSIRPSRQLRQSPPLSTAPARTLVHTVGRLETRPSLSSVVANTGSRAAVVIAANLRTRRRCEASWRPRRQTPPDTRFVVARCQSRILAAFRRRQLHGSHASNSRDPRGRAHVPPHRSRHAPYRRARALRRVASACHRDAGRDVHRAGHVHDRHAAARAWHRRQWLAVPRPHGSLAVAAIEPPSRRRGDLAGGTAPAFPFPPPQICFGGTTWRRATTSA